MNFKEIEESLDIELPQSYKEFISNYPDMLLADGFWAAEVELLNNQNRLVELNRFVRLHLDIELSYFLIGGSGCGDYYFIDISDEESPVYFWNHDIAGFDDDEESVNLIEHAGKLLESYTYVIKNT
ncbi:SMI1/KNR4 family protein [Microbulbifer sp. VAAF005]|uniref:SMI1/KNR4 family protein n=1 Tax=Microbulbifer sp. VAAF005 TaxID=3034230 RepID=UPI0024AD79EB|nr:SMI1/KNR4 family protein [Microbulbifer sp. VAAF005]WHI46443.1 SMI1/KNR4 family protein [Microbulbifer sp. VAAF005]